MGGSWERLIRSIRRILPAILQTQLTSDDVLTTVMAEAESILNSRPLITITLDPKDGQPLTPNHLLLLRESINLSPVFFRSKGQPCQATLGSSSVLDESVLEKVCKRIFAKS